MNTSSHWQKEEQVRWHSTKKQLLYPELVSEDFRWYMLSKRDMTKLMLCLSHNRSWKSKEAQIYMLHLKHFKKLNMAGIVLKAGRDQIEEPFNAMLWNLKLKLQEVKNISRLQNKIRLLWRLKLIRRFESQPGEELTNNQKNRRSGRRPPNYPYIIKLEERRGSKVSFWKR